MSFFRAGYAFALPLFRYVGGCRRLACYVHYPTISADMLDKVAQRRGAHNNAAFIARSSLLSRAKLVYYRLFAWAYGVAGNRADVIMVNSSWTLGHILSLWKAPGRTRVVYPPCDVDGFLSLPLEDHSARRPQTIVSIAQFRPEKDHPLQIKAFARFVRARAARAAEAADAPGQQNALRGDVRSSGADDVKLVLVGSCRNDEDRDRVEALGALARSLGVEALVELRLNVPFEELKKSLAEATVGLHTMWNEHFGIGNRRCVLCFQEYLFIKLTLLLK